MADLELIVPDIGDFDEVEVIEVLVSVGDSVEEQVYQIWKQSAMISLSVGQMSFKVMALPFLSNPSVSFSISKRIEPAIA